jgi:dTDP-4-amino-4,6-dideoxygalactose transaminase
VSARPPILVADPGANYRAHKEAIDDAVRRVLEGGWYILGKEVSAFEEEFSRYLGLSSAIGVGSGTEAIHLALRVCGIGPGDVVITVSHTAVATVAAIELAGATPLLVDIDPRTCTLDPNRLENLLDARSGLRVKAIIPVHLCGQPADLPAILDMARRHNLVVIEDCAQSHGATLGGRKTGTWGHLAAFSFYPTKNLGALGDGGALATNDLKLAERARLLREYGWRERYVSELPGMNTRLDEIQAAVLRVKLRYLDRENSRRRDLADIYHSRLPGTSLMLPLARAGVEHVYHLYAVRSGQRDSLREFLKERGVGTAIHYPLPVHQQPAYADRRLDLGRGLPVTERVCRETLSLPMHPQMSDDQAEYVSEQILAWKG